MVKKTQFSYEVVNEYYDENGRVQIAGVELKINFKAKTYSILSSNCYDHKFHFRETSPNFKLWKAVIKSIDEAIDFANKELNLS